MGYDVFISYSHGGDDLLSERVQEGLTQFAKPWYRRRALNVFRDRTALVGEPGTVVVDRRGDRQTRGTSCCSRRPTRRLRSGASARSSTGARSTAPTACWCC